MSYKSFFLKWLSGLLLLSVSPAFASYDLQNRPENSYENCAANFCRRFSAAENLSYNLKPLGMKLTADIVTVVYQKSKSKPGEAIYCIPSDSSHDRERVTPYEFLRFGRFIISVDKVTVKSGEGKKDCPVFSLLIKESEFGTITSAEQVEFFTMTIFSTMKKRPRELQVQYVQ